MIANILNEQTVEALGWTLLHSLWQAGAFAIALAVILIALRSYTAQSRYVVSVGLLCAFFLTVSATFYQQWQEADRRFELAVVDKNEMVDAKLVSEDMSIAQNLETTLEHPVVSPIPNQNLESTQTRWVLTFKEYYQRHLPLLVTIWLLGVLFLQLRFLGQLAYVQRLKHYGTQIIPASWNDKIEVLEGKLRIQKKVAYLTSLRVDAPMVIGWLKPAVLLPRQMLTSLSETEIYAILAHEIAHIRRDDFIVNLIQTFLCNVFFFHPGVWWMSHRIDDEREHCCDDLAVAATGQATSYAKTLINVSELQLRLQSEPALAMTFSGNRKSRERGGFSGRIKRLFSVTNAAGTFREGFATACILIAALFLGVVATGKTIDKTKEPQDQSEIVKRDIETEPEASIKNAIKQRTKTSTKVKIKESYKKSNDEEATDVGSLSENTIEDAIITLAPDERRIDALIMACAEGDFDFVKTLVKSGIDVNGIGSEGYTPLIIAASEDRASIVSYLLKKGADVNQRINDWTALHEAADEGSYASMKILLDAGADVNKHFGADNPTAITMAASEGNLDCLRLLLEYGGNINGYQTSLPPLHIAAAEDKRDIVDFLVSRNNILIDKKDSFGRTALMYAAAEGNTEMVRKLLDAGAERGIVDMNGNSASDYAGDEDKYETEANLKDDNLPAIHQATNAGKIEKVKRMVLNGTDVNLKDHIGRTPLHLAAAGNQNIDMQVLINLGANVNAKDGQNRTPLMYAAAAGHNDAATLLVSRLADVNIKDVDGMRALEWSHTSDSPNLTTFLSLISNSNYQHNWQNNSEEDIHIEVETDGNADVHTRVYKEDENGGRELIEHSINGDIKFSPRKNGQTNAPIHNRIDNRTSTGAVNHTGNHKESVHRTDKSLHLRQYDISGNASELFDAIHHESLNTVGNLLDNKYSVNTADETGQTALMTAARYNRLDVAKLLLDRGADVNQHSYSGLTALHYAALENHEEMAQILLNYRANVDPTMRYSSTDGNYSNKPVVWQYKGATPLFIAVESNNMQVLEVLLRAGANPKHILQKNEYRMLNSRKSYLDGSEVMGLDEDFLKNAEVKISDETWTPYKQALLMENPEMLAYFQN